MEAAALALGILSAFNGVVEDLRLLRVSQTFGHDYQTTQLKFQLTEARLVRWGVSVGVANREPPPTACPQWVLEKLVPESDREKAYQALQAITNDLDTAKKKLRNLDQKSDKAKEELEKSRQGSLSRMLGKNKDSGGQGLTKESQDGNMSTLTEDFKAMSMKRHRGTSTAKKAKWVLFERDELSALLSSVRMLVDELEALFPATHEALKSLAEEEASSVQIDELKDLLQRMADASEVRDKALLKAMEGSPGSTARGDGSFVFSNGANNYNRGFQTTRDVSFQGGNNYFGGGSGGDR